MKHNLPFRIVLIITGSFATLGFVRFTHQKTFSDRWVMEVKSDQSPVLNRTIRYYADGGIRQVETADGIYTYNYSANSILIIETDRTGNRIVFALTGALNEKKQLESGVGRLYANTVIPFTSNYVFEYDEKGYLWKRIEENEHGETITALYKYQHGDPVLVAHTAPEYYKI